MNFNQLKLQDKIQGDVYYHMENLMGDIDKTYFADHMCNRVIGEVDAQIRIPLEHFPCVVWQDYNYPSCDTLDINEFLEKL